MDLINIKAYDEFNAGKWKKETLENQVTILKNIYYNMKQVVKPYYDDCYHTLLVKLKELREYNIIQPIPENLVGEVYEVNVEDIIPDIKGTTYVELYIPYYDLHMNLSHNASQGGFNLFLND